MGKTGKSWFEPFPKLVMLLLPRPWDGQSSLPVPHHRGDDLFKTIHVVNPTGLEAKWGALGHKG